MRRVLPVLLVVLLLCGCGAAAKSWQEEYDLGVRYLSEGNYEEAILAFEAAIEIDPKRAEAYLGLADVYVAQGDLDAAREVLDRAVEAVGLERRMVKSSISSQILVVFFAPLLVAAIHVAFDFKLMLHLLAMFGLHEGGTTLLCTAGTFLVFAVIYGLVYLLTARTYYRIVQ